MSQDTVDELDIARANLLFELGASTDHAACLEMAKQLRKSDAAQGVIAVPRHPSIGMVFAAQRVESGNPAFDKAAPRMYEFYEVMILSAIENSPFKWTEPVH